MITFFVLSMMITIAVYTSRLIYEQDEKLQSYFESDASICQQIKGSLIILLMYSLTFIFSGFILAYHLMGHIIDKEYLED